MIYLGNQAIGFNKSDNSIALPSNVEVKTFTLDSDITGSSNVTIANPFGRTNIKRIICINFESSPTNGLTVAFVLSPTNGISDNPKNRKIVAEGDAIYIGNYFAIVSMSDSEIVLRNNGNFNFSAGTYYMFAW